ncbi:MAG: IS1595 family transposase [Candidatus Babeliaceae bacterium]|nr:IS1595 family transposase [Candidatus Babeliaceae bacterium]
MKMPKVSLLEWQNRYGTERACEKVLVKIRWPNGFICPRCNSKDASYITTRKVYQCSQCRYQVSITAGTLFHSTNLSLVKWFWAIYLAATDKGGISALRLAKHMSVSWPTARKMLKKIRVAMADRDNAYRLENVVEFDDAYVGGKRTGKRGRGAAGKKPILVAVETRGEKAGFMAVEAVDVISKETVRDFLQNHLKVGQTVRTDAFPALNSVKEMHYHQKKVVPAEEISKWLPLVHVVIGNLKKFLNGTFHGVSLKYLQEYLDEFSYRFNRRFWEPELPLRLLNACLSHVPVKVAENSL